jgi:hypothetical protein
MKRGRDDVWPKASFTLSIVMRFRRALQRTMNMAFSQRMGINRVPGALSNLYTTGEVTLNAIPEPGTLAALGLLSLGVRVRRPVSKSTSLANDDVESYAAAI